MGSIEEKENKVNKGLLSNPENYGEGSGISVFENYISLMRVYLEEENKWLEKQSTYVNRWDFQLLEPWYIKQAAEYQLEMYYGYRDDAKYMLEIVNAGDLTDELSVKVDDAKDRRDKFSELYYAFGNEASEIFDLRKFLVIIPSPDGCTEENMSIPSTFGSVDWKGDDEERPLIPLDPDLVS